MKRQRSCSDIATKKAPNLTKNVDPSDSWHIMNIKKWDCVMSHDYTNLVKKLQDLLGESYEFGIFNRAEGGIEFIQYPNKTDDHTKAIRMTQVPNNSALFTKHYHQYFSPPVTLTTWAQKESEIIFDAPGSGVRSGYVWMDVILESYCGLKPMGSNWLEEEISAVNNALSSVGFVNRRSQKRKK
jgi:hypothetical protein